MLKPNGIFMSTGAGPAGQNLILTLATPVLGGGRKVLFSFPRISQATVQRFRDMMKAGQFIPVLDRRYPLE